MRYLNKDNIHSEKLNKIVNNFINALLILNITYHKCSEFYDDHIIIILETML